MSKKYKFNDSRKPHFVSFTIVNWIGQFTRQDYIDIVIRRIVFKRKEILNARRIHDDQLCASDEPIRAEFVVR